MKLGEIPKPVKTLLFFLLVETKTFIFVISLRNGLTIVNSQLLENSFKFYFIYITVFDSCPQSHSIANSNKKPHIA